LWSGSTIDSLGGLFAWQGRMSEENMRQVTTLKRAEVQELWQRITDAEFFQIDSLGAGNITQMMMVRANGRSHRVSWARPPGNEVGNTTVQRLYDFCTAFISQR
jgi:hypothetical protein